MKIVPAYEVLAPDWGLKAHSLIASFRVDRGNGINLSVAGVVHQQFVQVSTMGPFVCMGTQWIFGERVVALAGTPTFPSAGTIPYFDGVVAQPPDFPAVIYGEQEPLFVNVRWALEDSGEHYTSRVDPPGVADVFGHGIGFAGGVDVLNTRPEVVRSMLSVLETGSYSDLVCPVVWPPGRRVLVEVTTRGNQADLIDPQIDLYVAFHGAYAIDKRRAA